MSPSRLSESAYSICNTRRGSTLCALDEECISSGRIAINPPRSVRHATLSWVDAYLRMPTPAFSDHGPQSFPSNLVVRGRAVSWRQGINQFALWDFSNSVARNE